MTPIPPFDAPLADHAAAAEAALAALHEGDTAAAWRFKWMHPRFANRPVRDVHAEAQAIDLADARLLVARELAFETWDALSTFAEASLVPGPLRTFELAADAVVTGDLAAVGRVLADDPGLAGRRSTRRHRASLLHYVAANGVESYRQRTPACALDIARLILDAGADVDALAETYDAQCTALTLLVSSGPPAEAGLQRDLALLLLDYGAAPDGRGSRWTSAVRTALIFGFLDTARALAGRLGDVDGLVERAGLGDLEATRRLAPEASDHDRQAALALGALLGHADVVAVLLAHGADPDRYHPDGFHGHATPLHHAAGRGHRDVVERLVEAGARLDVRDTIYEATPLGWAEHTGQDAIAQYLRARA